MNSTLTKNAKPFWEIAQYLSERGFAVLRYDKRGVGATSYTVSNQMYMEMLQPMISYMMHRKL